MNECKQVCAYKIPVTFISTPFQIRTNPFLFFISLVSFGYSFSLIIPTTCPLITVQGRGHLQSSSHPLILAHRCPFVPTHNLLPPQLRKTLYIIESRNPNRLGFIYLFSNLNILKLKKKKGSTKIRKRIVSHESKQG